MSMYMQQQCILVDMEQHITSAHGQEHTAVYIHELYIACSTIMAHTVLAREPALAPNASTLHVFHGGCMMVYNQILVAPPSAMYARQPSGV